MGVLAFYAKGFGLYSIGDGTPSCLCISDLSGQISVFGRGWKRLQTSDPLEKSSLHIYLAVFWIFKILHVFKNQETIVPPKKLKDPASLTSYSMWLPLAEANWWRSNLDCVWALQVALIPLLFVSLPTLSPNKWGHLSSGSLHTFLTAKKCFSILMSVSKVGKWKIDQEDHVLPAKWERVFPFLHWHASLIHNAWLWAWHLSLQLLLPKSSALTDGLLEDGFHEAKLEAGKTIGWWLGCR